MMFMIKREDVNEFQESSSSTLREIYRNVILLGRKFYYGKDSRRCEYNKRESRHTHENIANVCLIKGREQDVNNDRTFIRMKIKLENK